MNISISILFLLFIIYSFFGWCMEVVVCYFSEKKIINRGFLIGPLCPIYGVGVTLIHFLLYRYMDDPFVLFVMAVLVCSILEYFTGYIMEKMFKARWWDYSHKKFNINGRICLDNLVAFGILGLLVMYVLNPFFIKILSKIPSLILHIISIFLLILLICDLVVSFKVISGFKNVAKSMKKDNTDEITKKVREMLLKRGGLYKRLVLAFENFQISEMLLRITDQIKETANDIKESAKEALDRLDDKFDQIEKTGKINIKSIEKIAKDSSNDYSEKNLKSKSKSKNKKSNNK